MITWKSYVLTTKNNLDGTAVSIPLNRPMVRVTGSGECEEALSSVTSALCSDARYPREKDFLVLTLHNIYELHLVGINNE